MNGILLRIFFVLQFALSLTPLVKVSAQNYLQDTLKTQNDTVNVMELLNDRGTVDELEMEIDGLLIDETRTKTGRDFYDLFYSLWESPIDARNFLIRIVEKPYKVNLSMIEIWVNEEIVVNTVLQPRRNLIEELANNVNQSLSQYLINYSQITKQLESEDQSGTGIY